MPAARRYVPCPTPWIGTLHREVALAVAASKVLVRPAIEQVIEMWRVCWLCCGLLALFVGAAAAFIVWTIVATNPLWKAEDVGSANFMLPSCHLKPVQAFINPTAAYLHGRCIGTLESILLMSEVDRQNLCTKIPVGTTLAQIRDVVTKYAEDHPDQTNNDFRRFAFNALHEAWPCK